MQNPIDQIRTPRLLLRGYRLQDAPAYKQAVDESADQLLPWLPFQRYTRESLTEKQAWMRQQRALFLLSEELAFGIFAAEDGKLLGGVTLYPDRGTVGRMEMGYWIRTGETGRGFATEAAYALTRFAFLVLQAEKMVVKTHFRNKASARIPKKLNFSLECMITHAERDQQGQRYQVHHWSMFPEHFQRMKAYEPLVWIGFFGERYVSKGEGLPESQAG